MKLICERDALARALSHVVGRARNKTKIPILSHVKLDAFDRQMKLTATDLTSKSDATCPAEIAAPGAVTVSAERLFGVVDGMPKGSQVDLDLRESDLHVRSGGSRYRLPTLPVIDFPTMAESEDPVEFSLTCLDARALFGEPTPAVEVNGSRIVLEGGCLHQTEDGNIAVVATDGKRLISRSVASKERFSGRYIVRKAAMTEIVKLAAEGDIGFRVGRNLIEVTAGNCSFTSKLIDAEYPDVTRVIPAKSQQFILVDRAELVAALRRLSGLITGPSTFNLAWRDAVLSVSLSGEGAGTEQIACECDLPPGEIAFAPDIFRTMLDANKGDVVQLHINDPNKAVLILNPADDGLLVLAMPCRPHNLGTTLEAA